MQEELNCVQCEHWCGTTADKNRIRVSCYNHIDNCQCNCNSLFLLSWLKPCLCMCNVSSNATKTLRFKPYIWYLNRILYTYTSALVYMKLNAIVLSNREMVCWLLSKCSCVCVFVFLYILRNEMNHLPLSCDWYSKFSYKNMKHGYMRTIDTHSLHGFRVNECACVCRCASLYSSNNEINVEE